MATGATQQLTMESGGADQPAWSPDGTMLAYNIAMKGSVAVQNYLTDGGLGTPVTLASDSVTQPFAHPSFTPNGQGVIMDHKFDAQYYPLLGGPSSYIISMGMENEVQTPVVSPGGAQVALAMNCNGLSIWLEAYPGQHAPCDPDAGTRFTTMNNGTVGHPRTVRQGCSPS